MAISEFCNRNVVCITRDASIIEAAALMRKHHIGDVLVVDETGGRRKPVGIVTDRDLVVEVMASGLDARGLKVADLLTKPLITVEESASYAQTVGLMSAKGVRRLPVVSTAGELVGIITFDDILWQLASPLASLAALTGWSRRLEASALG
jgi:CBS domain-containing protein